MNIQKMMKQAQQMQAKMADAQEEISKKDFEGEAGGGKVKAVARGVGQIVSIKIDPSVVDPSDTEFLEDLVLKAVQTALETGKAYADKEMGKMTAGLNIPGMPF